MADFTLYKAGSIWLLRPVSPAARSWARRNLPRDTLWFAGAAVIDRTLADAIIRAARDDELEVG